jgi:hypothetical protein
MADLTNESIPDSEKIFLTAEQVAETEAISIKRAAKQYLKDTDWYAIRYAETGKAIPSDVAEKRIQARLDAS